MGPDCAGLVRDQRMVVFTLRCQLSNGSYPRFKVTDLTPAYACSFFSTNAPPALCAAALISQHLPSTLLLPTSRPCRHHSVPPTTPSCSFSIKHIPTQLTFFLLWDVVHVHYLPQTEAHFPPWCLFQSPNEKFGVTCICFYVCDHVCYVQCAVPGAQEMLMLMKGINSE